MVSQNKVWEAHVFLTGEFFFAKIVLGGDILHHLLTSIVRTSEETNLTGGPKFGLYISFSSTKDTILAQKRNKTMLFNI